MFDSIFNDTFFTHRTSYVPAVNISESAEVFYIEMADAAEHAKDEDVKA